MAAICFYFSISASGTGPLGPNYDETTFGYDLMNRQIRVVDPTGTVDRSVFDVRGLTVSTWTGTNDRLATDADPSAGGASGNNMVQIIGNVYDSGVPGGDSNLTTSTAYVDASTVRDTEYSYDFRNRRITTTDEEGYFEHDFYDNLDQVIQVDRRDTNAGGNLIARSVTNFDNRGRVYQTLRYAVNPSTGVAGPYLIDNTWYDATNNVLCSLPAGSQAFTKSTFDGLGRAIAVYTGYNPSGVIVPNSVSSDLIFEQVDTQYDSDSAVLFRTSRQRWQGANGVGPLKGPSGSGPNSRDSYMATWYDGGGRQIASANYGTNEDAGPPERPDGPPAPSDLVLVSFTNYNERGEGFESIDPAGQVSRQYSDDAGRTVRTIQNYVPSIAADGTPCLMPGNDENIIVDFVFGPGSLLYQLIARNPTTGDQVTRYQYGVDMSTSDLSSNRLLAAEIFPDAADSSDRESYAYNRQGQVKQKTDRNGTVHDYFFEGLGRQTSDIVTMLAAGVDGSVLRIDQSYEIRGMIATITSFSDTAGATPANQVQNTYNDFTQLSVQYQAHSGLVNTGTTPAVQYGYVNAVNNTIRPVSIIYPNGRVLNLEYASGDDESLSRVTDMKITGESTPAVAYTYFGLGSFASTTYPQPGVANTMASGGSFPGFDLFGRVINLPWMKGTTALAQVQYGYNRTSNRTYRQDVAATAAGKNLDELYQYDGLQRLRKYHQGLLSSGNANIQSPGMQQGWKLDATGNWANFNQFDPTDSAATLDQDRTANAFNEITGITNTVGAPWITPTYDRNGNTTTIPNPSDLADGYGTVYDAWNRLGAVNTGGGSPQNVVAYQYDGLNRRIVEKAFSPPGTLSETRDLYFSDAWQALEERVNGASTAETQYIWGLRYIDDCVLRDRDTTGGGTLNERLYAMQDANWDVVAIANTSGMVQERYEYTPYGVATIYDPSWNVRSSSSFDWRYLFQSGRFATPTGLYYFRNRDYLPVMGNWVQRDPIGYSAYDLSLNRFVSNNPSNVTDPSGFKPQSLRDSKDVAQGKFFWVLNYFDDNTVVWALRFTPNKDACACKNITFIQIVRATQGGAFIYPDPAEYHTEFETAKDKKEGVEKGWRVDHLKGATAAFYGAFWDAKEKKWTDNKETKDRLGNGPTGTPAQMADMPGGGSFSRQKGRGAVEKRFEVCGICIDTGGVLGCITWGFSVPEDKNADIIFTGATKNDFTDKPSANWNAAVKVWNTIAKDKGWFQVPFE